MSTRAHPRARSWLALTAHLGRLLIMGDTSGSSQEPGSYSDAQNSRAVPISRHGTFSFPGLLTDSAHASHVSREPLRGRAAPEASPNGGFGHKSLSRRAREGSVSHTLLRASQRPGSRGQAVSARLGGTRTVPCLCIASQAGDLPWGDRSRGINCPWG